MTGIEYLEEQDLVYDHFIQLTGTGINTNKYNIAKFAEDYLKEKHRELLVEYEKQHYTPNDWVLVSKQCEKEIDEFLGNKTKTNEGKNIQPL
jgi:hypothetical protein